MDFIQGINEQFRADALTEQLRHCAPDNNPGNDCIDCDNEIPIERRQAKPGCLRCITCQETFEIHSHWRAL
jgi:phage/conjugal plasmid C-4 type zinc finger TraR family protein